MTETYRFRLRNSPLPDGLPRLVGQFAFSQATIVSMDYRRRDEAEEMTVVVAGLVEARAAHLCERLRAMPFIQVADFEGC